ncbi:hypothetical protein [Streptomyces chartreusis]|uniref:hypothetical protein n=1 Tax=Streptomyces chartreusis TaxID=1969 RepID=UPI002E170B06
MKRNTLRIAGASAIAAIAVGIAGPSANALSHREAPAAPVAVEQMQAETAREAARALLNSTDPAVQRLLGSLTAEERAQLAEAAEDSPFMAPRINWGSVWNTLKKIGGFAKAIGGKYADFKRWVDRQPWYTRALIKSVTPGLSLYDLWWHFNH